MLAAGACLHSSSRHPWPWYVRFLPCRVLHPKLQSFLGRIAQLSVADGGKDDAGANKWVPL